MHEENKEIKDPIEPKFPWWVLLLVIISAIITGAIIVIFNWQVAIELLKRPIFRENYGQLGDIFGFSNAVFSGLAFILLAVGVWMQREELKDTKKLLYEQKSITQAQEAALKIQNVTTERQMFESYVFRLIENIQNEAANFFYVDVAMRYGIKEYRGRICLKVSFDEDAVNNALEAGNFQQAATVFSDKIQNKRNDYLNYLEMLCLTINFAFDDVFDHTEDENHSSVSKAEIREYLKHFFTSYELVQIGLMCIFFSHKSFPYLSKTKSLIEKNGLFQKLKTYGQPIETLKATFDISAWGGKSNSVKIRRLD
jgi:hypothetical protein